MTPADRYGSDVVKGCDGVDAALVEGSEADGAPILGRIGHGVRHEWVLAVLGAFAMAAAMTWPTLRHPTRTIPQDTGDPLLQAWQLAWDGHALTHQLGALWQANVFYPERYTLAFSDSLLGYGPLSWIGTGVSAAVLRYNLVYVLAFALAFLGAYLLLRQLGAGYLGALAGAVAFGFTPWRFSQGGHLHILSSGGILLALAMLARGHGFSLTSGYQPGRVRPRWAVAGWVVAGWQLTLGFGLGLPFAYLMLLIVLAAGFGFWRHRSIPLPLLRADLIGGVLFAVAAGVMMYPYLQVLRIHPDARFSVDVLQQYSPPLRGFFVTSQDSWLWGNLEASARDGLRVPAEMTLLPGFALIGFAALGLLVSVWALRVRLALLLGVLLSAWLAMGTAAPAGGRFGYLVLFYHLPGFNGARTPGRLVLWTIVMLCVLAAGAISKLSGYRVVGRPLAVLALGAVLLEGISLTPHPDVPRSSVELSAFAGPMMVLPAGSLEDMQVMLWSTAGFPELVNGNSGYNPPSSTELRQTMRDFPDQASVSALRARGVRTVVVLKDQPPDSNYLKGLTAAGQGLGLLRIDTPNAVVFTL